MVCQERSGFLFAHDCSRPAQYACGQCGKQVCKEHVRDPTADPLCISCFKDKGYRGADDYDPYYYRHRRYSHYHYDDRDHAAFDRAEDAAAGASASETFEADFDAS